MNTRALISVLVLALCLAAPAQAATKAQARRTVAREMRRQYDLRYPTVSCTKLTARRFKCHWQGNTERDIRDSNIGGWEGTARVVFYGRNADVDLHVTKRGH